MNNRRRRAEKFKKKPSIVPNYIESMEKVILEKTG